MPEDLKGLIEKIQEEGVKAAQDKAKEIEEEARRTAELLAEKAKAEAEEIIRKAKEKSAKMEESTKASLKQAARDILISLKKEINAILGRIVESNVRKALDSAELAKLIAMLVKAYNEKKDKDVVVSLKREDFDRLEKSLLSELKSETKRGIILKPSEEIKGGFTISYDGGKSYYDFTDKALAEYILTYLKPNLAEILKDSNHRHQIE